MISVKILSPIVSVDILHDSQDIKVKVPDIDVVEKWAQGVYAGDYDITPTVDGFTLNTANMVMENDVHVLSIPRFDVSNIDGTTVYIASEV